MFLTVLVTMSLNVLTISNKLGNRCLLTIHRLIDESMLGHIDHGKCATLVTPSKYITPLAVTIVVELEHGGASLVNLQLRNDVFLSYLIDHIHVLKPPCRIATSIRVEATSRIDSDTKR